MGKAYANRKKEKERPESDYYQTPRPLTWELLKLNEFDFSKRVLEPACGNGAITKELGKYFELRISEIDIRYGCNFLNISKNELVENYDYIITNPPFSLFDEFVMHAKKICRKFAFIGKTNFFGAEKRNRLGIWKNLKHVYIFNRQVDYRFFRKDNKLVCGNLITGWFIWDLDWKEDYWMTSIIDIQKYILSKKGDLNAKL